MSTISQDIGGFFVVLACIFAAFVVLYGQPYVRN